MKYTDKKFQESKCKKCIWLNKVNKMNYYCPFARCIKKDNEVRRGVIPTVDEVNETSKNSESKKGDII